METGLRRGVAIALLFGLVGGVLTGAEAARAATVVREIEVPGAYWYAVRLELQETSEATFTEEVDLADGWTSLACESYLWDDGQARHFASGRTSAEANGNTASHQGSFVKVQADDVGIDEQLGDNRPKPQPARSGLCGSTSFRLGAMTVDLLFLVASDGDVTRSSLTMELTDDVQVLAESWGVDDAWITREWDFAPDRDVHVGIDTPTATGNVGGVTARAMTNGRYDRSFTRHMLAHFDAGLVSAFVVAGPPLASTYVTDPDGRTTHQPRVTVHGGGAEAVLLGPYSDEKAGAYRFGFEWDVSAGALWPLAGSPSFVALLTADVDFPACSATPVVGAGPDGQPLCGEAA